MRSSEGADDANFCASYGRARLSCGFGERRRFDGSKLLICAPVVAMDCAVGEECVKGPPLDIGAPSFMRIDFDKKVIAGPKRSAQIQFVEKAQQQVLLQGTELGYGWTLALDQIDGKMAVTLVDRSEVFVRFGSCTPL
jgi:hypothetical protein